MFFENNAPYLPEISYVVAGEIFKSQNKVAVPRDASQVILPVTDCLNRGYMLLCIMVPFGQFLCTDHMSQWSKRYLTFTLFYCLYL